MSKRKTKLQTNTMHKLAYREGYSKEELKEQVEEIAHGLKIADYITCKEYFEYVEDVEKWLETATEGDAYYIDGTELVYNPQRDVENDETIYRITFPDSDERERAQECLDAEGCWYDYDGGDRMMLQPDGLECLAANDIDYDEV